MSSSTMLGKGCLIRTMNNVIEIRSLTKEFDGLVAVDSITLDVEEGKGALHYTESDFRLGQRLRI